MIGVQNFRIGSFQNWTNLLYLRSGKNSSPGHVPRAQPNIAPSNVWMWVLSFSEISLLIFLNLENPIVNLSQSCRQTRRNIEKYVLQAKLHQRKLLPQSKMKLLSKCIFTCLVCRTFYNTSNPPPATVKEKAEKEKKGIVSVIAFSHLFRNKCWNMLNTFQGSALKGASFKTKVCKFFSSGECFQVCWCCNHT